MGSQETEYTYDLVVIGCGAAGLASALTALETGRTNTSKPPGIAVLERAAAQDRGGNTRWTGANMRLQDAGTVADRFVEEMLEFSNGQSDERSVRTLAADIPRTIRWVQDKGIKLDQAPTYMLTATRPRIAPAGGGRQIVETLAQQLEGYGIPIFYETTAHRLTVGPEGEVNGVSATGRHGHPRSFKAKAVVIASGGFEGNAEMMTEHIGPEASSLSTVAPGGRYNSGGGIRMALDLGAKRAGQWDAFHTEPIDPRSSRAEAVIMCFPYGILVNAEGSRFVDEGAGTVDEIYEDVTRTIFKQTGQTAYFIADTKLADIRGYELSILTDQDPYQADTYADLAKQLGVDSDQLTRTIAAYNAATGQAREFDPSQPDSVATAEGLTPRKSNWARPVNQPPYLAYPITSGVVFTFGGIATNERAQVLATDNSPIAGLYAVGEAAGLYYGKYPGGTSVLRCLTFGRIAGRNAIEQEAAPSA